MIEALNEINNEVNWDWFLTLFTALVIILVTGIAASLTTKFLRRILKLDAVVLPSASIFVNIARAAIWTAGVCIMLATCFNINVTAIIAALGIGGVAISLGLQDTIANLVGGLQLTVGKIVEPGDRIKVGDDTGIVIDTTWRHTRLKTDDGDEAIIPNSVINKAAVTRINKPKTCENKERIE